MILYGVSYSAYTDHSRDLLHRDNITLPYSISGVIDRWDRKLNEISEKMEQL